MDWQKYKKYIIGIIAVLIMLIFILIQSGLQNSLFGEQLIFLGLFALVMVGGFAALVFIKRHY